MLSQEVVFWLALEVEIVLKPIMSPECSYKTMLLPFKKF